MHFFIKKTILLEQINVFLWFSIQTKHNEQVKGVKFLLQIQIFESLYLGNLMVETFDILNLDYLI